MISMFLFYVFELTLARFHAILRQVQHPPCMFYCLQCPFLVYQINNLIKSSISLAPCQVISKITNKHYNISTISTFTFMSHTSPIGSYYNTKMVFGVIIVLMVVLNLFLWRHLIVTLVFEKRVWRESLCVRVALCHGKCKKSKPK